MSPTQCFGGTEAIVGFGKIVTVTQLVSDEGQFKLSLILTQKVVVLATVAIGFEIVEELNPVTGDQWKVKGPMPESTIAVN